MFCLGSWRKDVSISHFINLTEVKWRIYASVENDIIASNDGWSPIGRQVIIWTNAVLLLIAPLKTNCCDILTEYQLFSFKDMHVKMSSAK